MEAVWLPWPLPVSGRLELALAALLGRHRLQPLLAEVAGAHDLAVAVVDGEVLACLAGAGEGAAIGLRHRDGATGAGRDIPLPAPPLFLADVCSGSPAKDALSGQMPESMTPTTTPARRRPDRRASTRPPPNPTVRGSRRTSCCPASCAACSCGRTPRRRSRQARRLLAGDLGGERIQTHVVPLVRGRSDPGGDGVLALAQVGPVALRVGTVDVHVLAGGRLGGVVAVQVTVVGGDRGFGQGDDVVALRRQVRRNRQLRNFGRLCGRQWAEPESQDGRQRTGERDRAPPTAKWGRWRHIGSLDEGRCDPVPPEYPGGAPVAPTVTVNDLRRHPFEKSRWSTDLRAGRTLVATTVAGQPTRPR